MNPRLLYVVNIPRFFVSHRLSLALAAREAGFDVHVATSGADPSSIAQILQHGLSHHPLPLDQHGMRPDKELQALFALVGLFGRLKPDLVHLVTIKPVLYGGIAARLTRLPAVIAAMSGLGRAFRDEQGGVQRPPLLLRSALRFALPSRTTHLLLQNAEDLEVLLTEGIAREGRATVIPGSGVDLIQFLPPRKARPPGQPVTFLYAGRLMRQKGVLAFVEAARRLRGRARFLLAGYTEVGSPGAIPIGDVERWAAEGIVEWLGARSDMSAIMREADVVVLPTVYGEGVPRTLIEAAACGRAIVTTDTPGCRDICRDRLNGILVEPGNDTALVEALEAFIAEPSLAERFGREGRRLAVDRFGLDRIIADTLALYGDVIAAGP